MLTRQYAEQTLDEMLRLRTELGEAEAKTGIGAPLHHAICAASNRRDRSGGIIYVGVDAAFNVVGLTKIEDIQAQIVGAASDCFNVPLRVAPEIIERDNKQIIAVIVPACPSGHRPCHFTKQGPYLGSWIRVGNSTRLMTSDEVRREIAADEIARGSVIPFDQTPLLQVPRSVIDQELVEAFIGIVLKARPASQIGSQSIDGVLSSIGAVAEYDGASHPTPTGILFFAREPQRYLPQSSVEFLHLWGPELTTPGPDGSRWRLNKEVFGTLPQIIDEIERLLIERVATRGFIEGFRRRDEPEYPRFALREAIVNAVAHRDYTLRGSRIQVRLYPNRIEVDTPGGLPAPVTVDNMEDEKAARNEAIVGPLQDFGYMERRGYGFNGIVANMREAGLSPPLVLDNGASFKLCLQNHVLMSPETVTWLRRFAAFNLTPQQRLALAYLRNVEGFEPRLFNRDYVRLTNCTSTEATLALRHMVDEGVLQMQGTRGGAYYTLASRLPDPQPELFDVELSQDEIKILELVRREGTVTNAALMKAFSYPRWRISRLLASLTSSNVLAPHGSGRGRYYTMGTPDS